MSSHSITDITSRQNERIKNLVKLRQRKERELQKCFLVEGLLEITRLHQSKKQLRELYFCADYLKNESALELIEAVRINNSQIFSLSPSVFDKVGIREGSDGILAVADTWELSLESLKLSPTPLLIIAESIEKPGNLGSLIRSAEAAGADALIICDPVTDIFNPNVVRASRGLISARQIALATPENVAIFLTANGIQSVALMPETERLYWEIDWKKPSAIVVGSEWAGLSAFWEKNASIKARLPMHGAGDSLNVSVAAAIALYESLRQRMA